MKVQISIQKRRYKGKVNGTKVKKWFLKEKLILLKAKTVKGRDNQDFAGEILFILQEMD